MKKPDFESAVIISTFIDRHLSDAIRKLADYLEVRAELKDFDDAMFIRCSYSDITDEWYVSVQGEYWNKQKIVKMIRSKK